MAGIGRYNRGLTSACMDFSGFFSEQKGNYAFFVDFSGLSYYLFVSETDIIILSIIETLMQPTKRQYRNDMPEAQKQAISQKLTGRTLSNDTKRKISQSMEKYWASLPMKPVTSTGTTSTNNTTSTSTPPCEQ